MLRFLATASIQSSLGHLAGAKEPAVYSKSTFPVIKDCSLLQTGLSSKASTTDTDLPSTTVTSRRIALSTFQTLHKDRTVVAKLQWLLLGQADEVWNKPEDVLALNWFRRLSLLEAHGRARHSADRSAGKKHCRDETRYTLHSPLPQLVTTTSTTCTSLAYEMPFKLKR